MPTTTMPPSSARQGPATDQAPRRMGRAAKAGIALALLSYAAAFTSGLWGTTLPLRLPEDYLSSLLLGLAIGFQTIVIADWQKGAGRSPRPLTTFLLTTLGGGLAIVLLTLSPDLWRNAVVTCATGLAVVALPRLAFPLHKRTGRCEAKARARDAGLAAAAILSLLGLLVDLSGLVTLPLSQALAIGGWIAASAYTATFRWLNRRAG